MLISIAVVGLLPLITDNSMVQGKVFQRGYQYESLIGGWIKAHRVAATWEEAYAKCRNEGFATLISPLSPAFRIAMDIFFDDRNTSYFIGTTSTFYPGLDFLSIEGISIDDMSVGDMFGALDSHRGQCLSMNRHTIREVPCTARLPYMCYKKQQEQISINECGTTEQVTGYKLYPETGSCYKLHGNKTTWDKAYLKCVEEGGHLAVINDAEEARVVFKITGNLTATNGHYYITVGNRDRSHNGDWMSIHGHRIEDIYNEWVSGKKHDPGFYCGRVYLTGPLDTGDCNFERPFLCEKDPSHVLSPNSDDENICDDEAIKMGRNGVNYVDSDDVVS